MNKTRFEEEEEEPGEPRGPVCRVLKKDLKEEGWKREEFERSEDRAED